MLFSLFLNALMLLDETYPALWVLLRFGPNFCLDTLKLRRHIIETVHRNYAQSSPANSMKLHSGSLHNSRIYNDCPAWCWNCTIVSSFLLIKHWNVMEGRIDRQTDRIPLAITVLGIARNADVLWKAWRRPWPCVQAFRIFGATDHPVWRVYLGKWVHMLTSRPCDRMAIDTSGIVLLR